METYRVYFSGSVIGPLKLGSGIYAIVSPDSNPSPQRISRVEFSPGMSLYHANYSTVAEALHLLESVMQTAGHDASEFEIELFGDSRKFIYHLSGQYHTAEANPTPFYHDAMQFLHCFANARFTLSAQDVRRATRRILSLRAQAAFRDRFPHRAANSPILPYERTA